MSIQVNVDCEHCGASYEITHNLDPQNHVIEGCSFCGSQDIKTDEDGCLDDEEHRVA